MDVKIVLVGAGSTAFGPSMLSDINLSKSLGGATIVLHDINKEKLDMIYDLLEQENRLSGNRYNIQKSSDRLTAFKDADFIISSIEVGDRFFLRWQDHRTPLKYGARTRMGECGGPGGFFHSARIIPEVVKIVNDAKKVCPHAFFINYSNPVARVCLAIKRTTSDLKFIGLCHQIEFFNKHLPKMLEKDLQDLKMTVVGLNHFGFLVDLHEIGLNENLMKEFNTKVLDYFKDKKDRFEFSDLTFEVYKRFGYFPHPGDNHLVEYLQFGDEYVYLDDIKDWIQLMQDSGNAVYKRALRFYKRLKEGKYPQKGMLLKEPSGERAIPIIEEILTNKKTYESSVNIPNDGIVDNLPSDLIIEGPAMVDATGVKGVKVGKLPVNIAALLRIEASIQDLCVEAILKRSKSLAINCLAIDPKVGSIQIAQQIYDEMVQLQRDYLPRFN
jgi:alpha-galactosidase